MDQADATEFKYNGSFEVTPEVKAFYDKNGYIIVRNLFNKAEIDKVTAFITKNDFNKMNMQYDSPEGGEGENVNMVVWNYPGNDLTGWVTRSERIVNTAEKLAGGELYLYHAKLILKHAKVGGAFQWHQDYGYWYENGCLYPNMITVMTALDRADKGNGCLQIIPGSHLMGRITHVVKGQQVTTDPERVTWALERLPLVHVELDPGDTVFFHCNLLHTSGKNTSDRNRYVFINSYNRMDNNPTIKHHHPFANKLEKVPDSFILEGTSPEVDWEGKDFMKPGFGRNEITKLGKN